MSLQSGHWQVPHCSTNISQCLWRPKSALCSKKSFQCWSVFYFFFLWLSLKRRWYKLTKERVWGKKELKMFRGNRLTESKARASQRNQKFLLKCSHLTFLPNRQNPTKHMGRGDEERLGFVLEYYSLCKIWQGHSCLKRSNPPLWKIWRILPSKEGKHWQLAKNDGKCRH